MFEVSVREDFSAAHRLRGYPGKCENVHGHNWVVEAFVRCERLDDTGITVDFKEIKEALRSVLAAFDHKDLNQLEPFDKDNPSSENIARYVYRKLSESLNSPAITVSKVSVCETPDACATYWEE